MKTVAIIQARMASTRLPGKVLADLGGKPVLAWVVRAARAALGVDDVWVATSTAAADDAVASLVQGRTAFPFTVVPRATCSIATRARRRRAVLRSSSGSPPIARCSIPR